MRVLVAGDRGYIGAVLVPFLRAAGHTVEGLDLGLYEGCDLGPGPEETGLRPRLDIRDVEPRHCAGYDAVVCLAALSNDPVRSPRRPMSDASCLRPRAASTVQPARKPSPRKRSCSR